MVQTTTTSTTIPATTDFSQRTSTYISITGINVVDAYEYYNARNMEVFDFSNNFKNISAKICQDSFKYPIKAYGATGRLIGNDLII